MATGALRSMSLLAAAFGAALFVAGLLAIAGLLGGGAVGGALTLVLAVGSAYAAYRLARAAGRARREAERAKVARVRAARLIGAATIVTGLGALVVPAPAALKVAGVLSAVAVVPIMFAHRSR